MHDLLVRKVIPEEPPGHGPLHDEMLKKRELRLQNG
jgi:hypothetical protein